MSESDVQARAEQIAEEMIAVAEGLPRVRDDIVRSRSAKVVLELPRDPWRYWSVSVIVGLTPDSPEGPVDVAEEIIRMLEADGWVDTKARAESVSGVSIVLGKQDEAGFWKVALTGFGQPPPSPQDVRFTVISPKVNW